MNPHRVAILLTTMACLIIVSCQYTGQVDEATELEYLEQGGRITQKLSGVLMGELSEQIREHGIVWAIEYCSLRALPLTDSISKAEGVEIGRVSHRYRNTHNAANDRELKIIGEYLSQKEQGGQPKPIVRKENSKYIYYAPIMIGMPTCLKCHGRPGHEVSPEVMQALSERYPGDLATGFEMGQLRGLFKVEFTK